LHPPPPNTNFFKTLTFYFSSLGAPEPTTPPGYVCDLVHLYVRISNLSGVQSVTLKCSILFAVLLQLKYVPVCCAILIILLSLYHRQYYTATATVIDGVVCVIAPPPMPF